MNLLGDFLKQQRSGLEEFDMDKALKKIPHRILSELTYKGLDKHVRQCAFTSKLTLLVLILLAMEKSAELLHISHFNPLSLLGGG